nr:hypothetical protein [uncultured Allomuricauda sp.]
MKKITVSTKERRFIIVFMIINCIALFVNVFEFNSFKDFYKDRYYYFTDNGKFDAVDINKTYFGPTKTSKDFFYPFIDFTESTFSTTANIKWKFRGIFPDFDYTEFIVYTIIIFGVVFLRKVW